MTNRISPMFSSYDRVSEQYSDPFVSPHAGTAIRSFSDAILRPENPVSPLANHPDDFELHHVGDFDATIGTVTPTDPSGRKPVISGRQVALQKSLNV